MGGGSTSQIDGLNVLQTVRIAPYEAVLGEHVSIKTYDGKTATVKLMAGTKNGQKYRLANQGIKKDDKVVVEGINMAKRHVKPRGNNDQGGIFDIEMPIHVSNVKKIDEVKKTAKKAL